MALSKDTRDIISYINGNMPLYRRPAFEERLQSEPELREKAEQVRNLRLALRNKPADEERDTLKKGAGSGQIRLLFYAAAAAILIFTVAYFGGVFSKDGSAPDKTAETEQTPPKKEEQAPLEMKQDIAIEQPEVRPERPENKKPVEKNLIQPKDTPAPLVNREKPVKENPIDTQPAPATFRIVFRQRTGTGGFAALPEKKDQLPAFVQDSVSWTMEVHPYTAGSLPAGAVGKYKVDRAGRILVLNLTEKGKNLLTNSNKIILERVSDFKSTVFNDNKPLFLLLGDGWVELAD